jgi:hypothetical protein
MRQQPEVLEHHAHLVAPQIAQAPRIELDDVGAVDDDLARGRLDEPVEVPHERRLAGTGEAHDHEDLAGPDIEAHVVQADVAAGLREYLGLRLAAFQQVEHASVARGRSEEFVDMLDFDRCHDCS